MASTFIIKQEAKFVKRELLILVSADNINIYTAGAELNVDSDITINLIVVAQDTSKPQDEHGNYPEVDIPATLTIPKGTNSTSGSLGNTQLEIVNIKIVDWSPTEDDTYIYNVV